MYAYSVGRALYSSSVPEFGILSCFVRVWCISEHLAYRKLPSTETAVYF